MKKPSDTGTTTRTALGIQHGTVRFS